MFDLIDFKMLAIVALVGLSVEGLFPLRAAQKTLRSHWMNDAVYFLVNGVLIRVGVLLIFAAALGGTRYDFLGLSSAVQAQPLWLQVIEAFLLADLGFTLRTGPSMPCPGSGVFTPSTTASRRWTGWRRTGSTPSTDLHQIRIAAAAFPLRILRHAIAIWAVAYQWQSLLIHSNTRLSLGPLRWILATPQFHHWHHANEPQAFNKNFAGQLPFLDALFGTLHMPGKAMPQTYGTSDPVPPLYHEQLLYPFRRGERPAEAPEQFTVAAGEKP